MLGRATLHLNRLGESQRGTAYSIIALDPHPAASNDSVTHPHISDGELCAGDAGAAIRAALGAGRIADVFQLVHSVLTTYNPGCPYAFMDAGRWDYRRQAIADGRWREGQDLVNNVLRKFQTRCRQAGVKKYTLHDLRRSAITNWALHLPIHVVQHLAGHSDIKTTQQYYLFIREQDIAQARQVQADTLGVLPEPDLTDPLLTHSAQKRHFPGRRGCQPKS